jgi:hypothetical protein
MVDTGAVTSDMKEKLRLRAVVVVDGAKAARTPALRAPPKPGRVGASGERAR